MSAKAKTGSSRHNYTDYVSEEEKRTHDLQAQLLRLRDEKNAIIHSRSYKIASLLQRFFAFFDTRIKKIIAGRTSMDEEVQAGERLMEQEKWAEAEKQWKRVLWLFESVAPGSVWARKARAEYNQGREGDAEATTRMGLRRYPKHPGLLYLDAESAARKQEWNNAKIKWLYALEEARETPPARAFAFLAEVYRELNELDRSESITQEGLEVYPEDNAIKLEAAKTAVARKDWETARRRWETILETHDETPMTKLNPALSQAQLHVSVLDRIIDAENYKKSIKTYSEQHKTKNKNPRIAVFTAISGGYDPIKLPEKPDSRFDYIVFTDTPLREPGLYDVRPLPYFHSDTTRSARFVKTHAHMLLNDYDIAVWVDSNITIKDDIYPFIEELVQSEKPVAAIPHPQRSSIYEEYEACIRHGKDEQETMSEQIKHYKDSGFQHDDLIESNFMVFDLHHEKTPKFLNTWWSEIDRFSKRDQISLNYALNKEGVSWHPLFEQPSNVRNHPGFLLTPHGTGDIIIDELMDTLDADIKEPFSDDPYSSVRKQRVAAQKDRSIDIIVCVHNALEEVKKCLDSIVHNRHNQNHNLIIVNDGSNEEASAYLQDFEQKHGDWTRLLRNETAQGYTKAANKGLEASDADLSILLNSDVIVTDSWAEKMADAVFATPGAGIVGPLSSAASHQSIPNHNSTKDQTAINELPDNITAEDMNQKCEEWTASDYIPRVPLMHGFCFGITKEAKEVIGYFDEKHFPKGYGEESDYCFRAVDAGFSLVIATHTYIFHAKSKSYIGPERIKLMERGMSNLYALHSTKRVQRAIQSMQEHPVLVKMREQAAEFYQDSKELYRETKK